MKTFLCNTASVLAFSLAVNAAFPAQARTQFDDYFPSWYVGLHGSVNAMQGSDLGTTPLPDTDYNPGFAAGGSVGMQMPRGFIQPLAGLRFEGEFTRYWQQIDNDRPALIAPIVVLSGGERDFGVKAYMINAYYHFPVTGIHPYIGGGFGKAQFRLQPDPGQTVPGETKDTTNAWQAMAGFAFSDSDLSLTEWSVGYKYFRADKPEFADGFGGITKIDATIHSVEAGVKFRF